MKVFLTGATGYVGGAVAERLLAAGHEITALVRDDAKAAAVAAKGFTPLKGNLRDLSTLQQAAAASDATVHTAIEWGPDAGEVDRAATEALLDALAGSSKPFLYTSGVWVYGDTEGRMAGEIMPRRAPEKVAWRPAVEDAVLAAKDRSVKSMVFRVGRVYGRGGGALAAMFKQVRENGTLELVGDGHNHWSSIHIDDLAELYHHALAMPYSGEAFIACGGMPQPVEKIARAVFKACGKLPDIRLVPVEEARLKLGPLAECLALDSKTGSTKAARYFGWPVRKPSIFEEILTGSYL